MRAEPRGLSHADCGEHHTGQVNANEAKARDSGCCAIFHLSILLLLLMDNVSISGRQNLAIAPVPQSQLFVGNHPWHFRLAVCDLLRIVLVIVSAAGAGQAAAVEVHLVPEQRQPNPTDHEQRSCRSGECYKGNGSFDYIRAHILALLPTPLPESLPRQTYDRTVLGTIALRAIVPTGTRVGLSGIADLMMCAARFRPSSG